MPVAGGNASGHDLGVLRDAERAWLSCRHGEALRLLFNARRNAAAHGDRAAVCAAHLAFARYALAMDDESSAEQILVEVDEGAALCAEDRARVWVVRSALERRRGEQAELGCEDDFEGMALHLPDTDLIADVRLEQAARARRDGDIERALDRAAAAQRLVDTDNPRHGLAELERAEAFFAAEDIFQCRQAFRAAFASFSALDLRLCEGRAALRCGELLGSAGLDGEASVLWFVRAQTVLGPFASPPDRSRIRAGFRRYGRRLADRAISAQTSSRLDAVERAYASLAGQIVLHAWTADSYLDDTVDGESCAVISHRPLRDQLERLPTQLEPLGLALHRATAELAEMLGAAIADRERMESLAQGMTRIEGARSAEQVALRTAELVASILDADRAIVVSSAGNAFTVLADVNLRDTGVTEEAWRTTIESSPVDAAASASELLEPEARNAIGPALAATIQTSSWSGAIYADKLGRNGLFRKSDVYLLRVLAEFLAQGLAQFAAREAEKTALAQLTGTLGALREGVIALDAAGVILQLNSAAARVLGVAEGALSGKRLGTIARLEPLASALLPPRRAEAVIVRLAHVTVVVTTRPVEMGATLGCIATLVEFEQAQRIALRVTGARPRYCLDDIIGGAPRVLHALRLARQAAGLDAPVLVTGQSGTGKEVFAQAIHNAGPRAQEPFVGINCAALPSELLEAELFGYERGAFTGARSDGALGKFEQAGEGTLLLDEIGDMPLAMQAKLLRVLEERTVTRLGGGRERPVHARIIATTNHDLDLSIERGLFRLDLFYRLRVLHIHLPPLRERPDDIEALAQFVARRVAQRQGRPSPELGAAVVEALVDHSWPGNVRELVNVIEREVSLMPSNATRLEQFSVPLSGPVRTPMGSAPKQGSRQQEPRDLRPQVLPFADVERKAFLDALDAFQGHVGQAAKALGVSRASFYAKLRRWGLRPADGPVSRDSWAGDGTSEREKTSASGMPPTPRDET